jgi:ATP-dependent helicase STH1/SNF2
MNDDELNLMLARNEEEITIFRDMDVQRERDALTAWRAAGYRGRPPPQLVQFEELPECYKSEEPFDVKEVDESMEGRGQRRRNVVSYTDGLSDDAWAMACLASHSALDESNYCLQALEEGEDIQELAERVRDKKERRLNNKFLAAAETSGRGTPASDVEAGGRGRKGKKGKAKMTPPDYDLTPTGKRKRGVKSTSVTPSINDDDDDDTRETVRAVILTLGASTALKFIPRSDAR